MEKQQQQPNSRSMVEWVPDSLQGFKVCGKFCAAILLLLQLPPECAQLLLSLHLDVVGHHHCRLKVRLEPTPLLFLLLKTKTYGYREAVTSYRQELVVTLWITGLNMKSNNKYNEI